MKDIQSIKILGEIIFSLSKLHHDIHTQAYKYIEKGDIEHKYMLCNIKKNLLSFESLSAV